MNSTDYIQTQQSQHELEPPVESDADIAQLADDIDKIFEEIAGADSNKGSRIAEFIHGGKSRTESGDTPRQLAGVNTLVGDALDAALPAGGNVGYDQARFESQPPVAQHYAAETGQPLTGTFARFAEMTKDLPITTIAKKAHEAEEVSGGIVELAEQVLLARKDFTGAPRDVLDVPKELL